MGRRVLLKWASSYGYPLESKDYDWTEPDFGTPDVLPEECAGAKAPGWRVPRAMVKQLDPLNEMANCEMPCYRNRQ